MCWRFFAVVSCLKGWQSPLTYTHTDILLPSTQTLAAKASTKAGEAIHLKRAGGGGRERERRKKIGFCSGRIFKLKHLTTKAAAINFKTLDVCLPRLPPPYSSSLYWARGPWRDGISSRAGLKLVSFDRSSLGFSAGSAPVWIRPTA